MRLTLSATAFFILAQPYPGIIETEHDEAGLVSVGCGQKTEPCGGDERGAWMHQTSEIALFLRSARRFSR